MCEPYTDIWEFATTLYRQPGIESLCLELQQEHSANIPLLLWLLWMDLHGDSNSTVINDARQRAEQWQCHVIEPLRRARIWMKQQGLTDEQANLRESIKACELSAEKNLLVHFPAPAGRYAQVSQYGASQGYVRELCKDRQYIDDVFQRLQQALANGKPDTKNRVWPAR